jgi:hypothetical protein
LVEFTSAQRSAGNNLYMVDDANHMEVCKPPSKEHHSYMNLLQFIIDCQMAQVEDMDCYPGNTSEGYHSDGTPSTCSMLVSSSWLVHEVVEMVAIQVMKITVVDHSCQNFPRMS